MLGLVGFLTKEIQEIQVNNNRNKRKNKRRWSKRKPKKCVFKSLQLQRTGNVFTAEEKKEKRYGKIIKTLKKKIFEG